MTNRELVTYCQLVKCEGCEYKSECDRFCRAYHFSPCNGGEEESDEFLDKEVGECGEFCKAYHFSFYSGADMRERKEAE